MQNTMPTVILDPVFDEALERLLSPMDEIVFLQQIRNKLPKLHQPQKASLVRRLQRNSLYVYEGLVEWCGIHFLYVQFDDHLHILRFEPSCDDDRRTANVLLGEPEDEDTAMQEYTGEIPIAF